MASQLPLESISQMADDEDARMGASRHTAHRLSGDQLLRSSGEERGAEKPRRSGSAAYRHIQQTRHTASGAETACRNGCRRSDGLRERQDHPPPAACRQRRDILLHLGSRQGVSGSGAALSRIGRSGIRQLLRRPQLGGILRRIVCLHPQGRALPDGALDLLPHQRQRHRSV